MLTNSSQRTLLFSDPCVDLQNLVVRDHLSDRAEDTIQLCFAVSEAYMIGEIEVDNLKGVMDVRIHLPVCVRSRWAP